MQFPRNAAPFVFTGGKELVDEPNPGLLFFPQGGQQFRVLPVFYGQAVAHDIKGFCQAPDFIFRLDGYTNTIITAANLADSLGQGLDRLQESPGIARSQHGSRQTDGQDDQHGLDESLPHELHHWPFR